MGSRYFFWWKAWSASVTLFLRKRLKALGEVIAHDLEQSYGNVANDFSWPVRSVSDRSAAGTEWHASSTLQDLPPKEKIGS
jgi:hypothetical protein